MAQQRWRKRGFERGLELQIAILVSRRLLVRELRRQSWTGEARGLRQKKCCLILRSKSVRWQTGKEFEKS
jgi:hypothetical protein